MRWGFIPSDMMSYALLKRKSLKTLAGTGSRVVMSSNSLGLDLFSGRRMDILYPQHFHNVSRIAWDLLFKIVGCSNKAGWYYIGTQEHDATLPYV
jgi:hypothetical protein